MLFNQYVPYDYRYNQNQWNNQNPYIQQNNNAIGQQIQQSDERIWVQSQQAAEAYLVAPNAFVRLWDSTQPLFYEKRADNTGRPYPMEIFEYKRKEQPNAAQTKPQGNISTAYEDHIKQLEQRIELLEKEIKKNVYKSNADDTAIQPVQGAVSGRPTAGSTEITTERENEPTTA